MTALSVSITTAAPVADPTLGDPVLDNAIWHALTGPHQPFARRVGRAARYDPAVARFIALADGADPTAWADLATLCHHETVTVSVPDGYVLPTGWVVEEAGHGVQLVDVAVAARHDPEAVVLGPADVPEILDLVERTRPGPFTSRTIELGTYLGIRHRGRLVAMAGERMRPPGWTEISAVCTDPAFRGRGLGGRLVQAVAAGIVDRGEQVLLHALATNTYAIGLYESMGFRLRRHTTFLTVTPPAPGR